MLLPVPRRLCFHLCLCLSVCFSVKQDNSKATDKSLWNGWT